MKLTNITKRNTRLNIATSFSFVSSSTENHQIGVVYSKLIVNKSELVGRLIGPIVDGAGHSIIRN